MAYFYFYFTEEFDATYNQGHQIYQINNTFIHRLNVKEHLQVDRESRQVLKLDHWQQHAWLLCHICT